MEDDMTIGKSIRVYLADATVSGVRYAELVNWTGQAIACPRKRLAELKNWSEAQKPGIYFLFENRFSGIKPVAYIGESENVYGRLTSHARGKDFWSDVVIFTSKDQNLTKAHIKYLESRLVELSRIAGRYDLENGNTPPQSSLPRADKDAMEEFVQNTRMVLGILGFSILEPLINRDEPGKLNSQSEERKDELNLLLNINGCNASGALTDEGFVIKSNSEFKEVTSSSLSDKLNGIRTKLIETGVLRLEKGKYISTEDVLVSSSSSAASLIAGNTRSGPQNWKTEYGVTLKQMEDDAINEGSVSNPQL
jgi:hypothetical protein